MACEPDTFVLYRGSDFLRDGIVPSTDLTGYTIVADEVHPALVGRLTLSIPNPATGAIRFQFNWDADMPMGRVMHFRPRLVSGGGISTAMNKLWVNVK
jgi:hypothetical protein